MIEITPILLNLIEVLAGCLTIFVLLKMVPLVKAFFEPFKDKYPMEASFLEKQAEIAVGGAEQQFKDQGNPEKLTAALIYVEKQANRYGYQFDEFAAKMLIEAKYRELKEKIAGAIKEKGGM